jgi:hypothetical protein
MGRVLSSWQAEPYRTQRAPQTVHVTIPAVVNDPPFGQRLWLRQVISSWEPVVIPHKRIQTIDQAVQFVLVSGGRRADLYSGARLTETTAGERVAETIGGGRLPSN